MRVVYNHQPNKILFTLFIFKKIKFSIDKLFFNRTFTTQNKNNDF
ncbi:hypothetical protein SAMN05216490_1295 [Mucilaginibacter mallensis]|uniref:Uncharacterized protein n=1 Tax=Mucilaginibacter mallensis TaxID=652787 RepID=A0A1H1SUP1_MUCMA|nr:hypothetical protein SAMN05216490_1295 [Mucilaginibacter mallensis]